MVNAELFDRHDPYSVNQLIVPLFIPPLLGNSLEERFDIWCSKGLRS
jgi:hypothetical protein